jgi:hypothetical protein
MQVPLFEESCGAEALNEVRHRQSTKQVGSRKFVLPEQAQLPDPV